MKNDKKKYFIFGGLILAIIIAAVFVVLNFINGPIPVPDINGIIEKSQEFSDAAELEKYCERLERSATTTEEYQNSYRGCGIALIRKGKLDKSLPWLSKADETLITDKYELSEYYSMLFSAYSSINDNENAKKYFDKAFEIREELHLNIGG